MRVTASFIFYYISVGKTFLFSLPSSIGKKNWILNIHSSPTFNVRLLLAILNSQLIVCSASPEENTSRSDKSKIGQTETSLLEPSWSKVVFQIIRTCNVQLNWKWERINYWKGFIISFVLLKPIIVITDCILFIQLSRTQHF